MDGWIIVGLEKLMDGKVRSGPADRPVDLGEIYRVLAAEGRLAGFEVARRFFEVGSLRPVFPRRMPI
jgi:hypothetical protein